MGEFFDQLPDEVRDHIRSITKTSGLPQGEDSVDLMAQGWLEKKKVFEEKIEELGMEEVDEFPQDSLGGALVLTYSGSLLTVGPLIGGVRTIEYISLGIRQDVPESAVKDGAALDGDIVLDEAAVMSVGPVKKTSSVFKIAVTTEKLTPDEEAERLIEATQILTEEFVEVNKTLIME